MNRLILMTALASPLMGQAPTTTTPQAGLVPAKVVLPPPKAAVAPLAVITAPATVPEGSPLVLLGDKSTAATLTWKVIRSDLPLAVYDQPGHPGVLAVAESPPAGEYLVALTAIAPDGTTDVDVAEVMVLPSIPIAPEATGTGLTRATPRPRATLVFDPSLPIPPAFRSLTLPGDLDALGVDWSLVPAGRAAAKLFGASVAAESVPIVVYTDATGGVQGRFRKPSAASDVVAGVKLLRVGSR